MAIKFKPQLKQNEVIRGYIEKAVGVNSYGTSTKDDRYLKISVIDKHEHNIPRKCVVAISKRFKGYKDIVDEVFDKWYRGDFYIEFNSNDCYVTNNSIQVNKGIITFKEKR